MSTDQDFYVVRHFSESSIRVALFMQYEITCLEEQLRYEDEESMRNPMDNSTFHFDQNSRRRWEILPRLAQCIREYRE